MRAPRPRTRSSVSGLRLAGVWLVSALVSGAVITGLPAAPAAAAPGNPNEIVALLVQGVGNGHGRGMSQWGAYGRAVNGGQNWQQILDTYYGGTTLGDAANRDITVRLVGFDDASTVGIVSETSSLRWRAASGGGGPYRSMYAQKVGGNTYAVFGSASMTCGAAAAPNVPSGPLREGDRNAAVADLQRVLAALGHNPGGADGVFGPMTASAVRSFQNANGLPVTGVWGSAEATRARQLLDGSGSGAGWVSLGTHTGPIEFTTDVNTVSSPAAATIGVCRSGGEVVHYRGAIIAMDPGGTPRTINRLPIESYLRGVVPREVSASWGAAGNGAGANALSAQAVAARSYALSQSRYSYAQTCDTTACQAYGGAARRPGAGGAASVLEHPATDQAIASTAGKVRMRNGSIVSTEYSASNGPRTAGGEFPAVEDPFDNVATNPNHTWTRIIPASAITSRYNLASLSQARTEPDPTLIGRGIQGIWANRVVLNGSSVQTSWNFRGAFGLPSPGFTITPITRTLASNESFAFIGDSVGASITTGANPPLPALLGGTFSQTRFDAVGSRCTSGNCSGGSGVAAAASVPQGAGLVVVQLGYNDNPLDANRIDAMMNALRSRGVQRVAWVNLSERRAGSPFANSNRALDAATQRWPELQIWDWNSASAGATGARWFTDSLHLSATGRAEFSRWLRIRTLTAMGVDPGDTGATPDASLPSPSPGTPPTDPSPNPSPPDLDRMAPTVIPAGLGRTSISGADRYQTAAEVVASAFTDPVASVILVSGADYPDGLAAAGLSGIDGAPVLLTQPGSLPEATRVELQRLAAISALQLGGPLPVTIIGGTRAVSAGVESELRTLGFVVTRLSGSDRYETAGIVARQMAGQVGTTQVGGKELATAILATGENFPDALAAGAGAAQARLPLLLTRRGSLPGITSQVVQELGIERVIVLGGAAAVDDGVLNQLRADGVLVERVAGTNRADTAANFARLVLAPRSVGGLGFEDLMPPVACGAGRAAIVVDGRGFADALSSGPFAARCLAPILLSSSSATTGFLQLHLNVITRVIGVGGRVVFV